MHVGRRAGGTGTHKQGRACPHPPRQHTSNVMYKTQEARRNTVQAESSATGSGWSGWALDSRLVSCLSVCLVLSVPPSSSVFVVLLLPWSVLRCLSVSLPSPWLVVRPSVVRPSVVQCRFSWRLLRLAHRIVTSTRALVSGEQKNSACLPPTYRRSAPAVPARLHRIVDRRRLASKCGAPGNG